ARGRRRREHMGHRPHATGESPPIRRNTHGPRSGHVGGRPIRFLPRGAESRHPGRLELSHHWWSQPDTDRAGIELAHGPTPRGRVWGTWPWQRGAAGGCLTAGSAAADLLRREEPAIAAPDEGVVVARERGQRPSLVIVAGENHHVRNRFR